MSAETTCRFEELDRGVLAVTLRPELNEVPWTDIERIGAGFVERVASRDRPRVLVDLTELNHMGSAMVALVVRVWKAVSEKNGRMIVVNRNDLVEEVLEISGLANKWTILPSRDNALETFRESGFLINGGRSSKGGVVLVVLSAVFVVVAALALGDAVSAGLVAGSIGKATVLWAGFAAASVALLFAVIAIVRTAGNLKLISVVLATLAVVAAVVGLVMVLGGAERIAGAEPVEPAATNRPD